MTSGRRCWRNTHYSQWLPAECVVCQPGQVRLDPNPNSPLSLQPLLHLAVPWLHLAAPGAISRGVAGRAAAASSRPTSVPIIIVAVVVVAVGAHNRETQNEKNDRVNCELRLAHCLLLTESGALRVVYESERYVL